ncbi:hypothetical protein H5410_030859 [Solanum commersonii]|uniref:Uncharacterized protein n=1 Tax=Solanum commersonii TaxID=4109 RepID=A0A9J5YGW2_SOLCO|nr:hypothetical protein H5410_030859 [Solanum commersonii]
MSPLPINNMLHLYMPLELLPSQRQLKENASINVQLHASSRAMQSGAISGIKKKREDISTITYQQGGPSHRYPNNPQIVAHSSCVPYPLRTTRVLQPVEGKLLDLIPCNFDRNKRCAYHLGVQGHDIEDCYGLKNQIESLIRRGLTKCTPSPPNVKNNPLPNHENQKVNMVTPDEEYEGLTVQA